MHIHITGEGTPTVVFESGMGASCLSWTLVQPQVAQFTRAVSYDRVGHGWSDPASERRTALQIAQELHTLLDTTGVPGPYVLVGHSFGGYVNRAFAHMYRNEVAGMVLVDSVHPAEWENPTPEQLRMIEVGLRYAWIAAWLARLGFVRFCGWRGVRPGWDGQRRARSALPRPLLYSGLRVRFVSCPHQSCRLRARCGRSRRIS
jgi:pimeloyl-ACP methyl ester carboxylesterase